MSYKAELWQDGILVVCVDSPTKKEAEREINHYGLMYSEDGEVEIKRKWKKI